jgi:hypothetical protein
MKACVIELNQCHTEIFPIYENFLPIIFPDRHLEIHYFVVPRKYEELKNIYGGNLHKVYQPAVYYVCSKTGMRSLYFKYCVNRIVSEHQPDLIIFNSIVPKRIWYAFDSISDKLKFGIVHGFDELSPQERGNTFYFVLGESLFQKYSGQNIHAYLLPFFPQFTFKQEKQPKYEEVVIAIQGSIDFRRRDYPLLVEIAKELKVRRINGIKFNIVGDMRHRDARRLRNMVSESGVQSYFLFHRSLNDEQFYREIIKSHFLMPLLTDTQRSYLSSDRISSTLSHSGSYNKPMILSQNNANIWQMNDQVALIYEEKQDLIDVMMHLPDEDNYSHLCKSLNSWREKRIEENRRHLQSVFENLLD